MNADAQVWLHAPEGFYLSEMLLGALEGQLGILAGSSWAVAIDLRPSSVARCNASLQVQPLDCASTHTGNCLSKPRALQNQVHTLVRVTVEHSLGCNSGGMILSSV